MIDAFDWRWREGAGRPKMMSIGMHLRIIGRPARIAGLARVRASMQSRGGAWLARREPIGQHWLERFAAKGEVG